MAIVPFSAALDTRVLWAQYRIALIADPANADPDDVMDSAIHLGRLAYPDLDLPLMIADVPQLVALFNEGFRDVALDTQVANCHWCQDDTGRPCPSHDQL